MIETFFYFLLYFGFPVILYSVSFYVIQLVYVYVGLLAAVVVYLATWWSMLLLFDFLYNIESVRLCSESFFKRFCRDLKQEWRFFGLFLLWPILIPILLVVRLVSNLKYLLR